MSEEEKNMKKMTERALNDSMAGESMAHIKYLAFSEAAEREGLPNIAKLFRAIAYAEQVHAVNHARTLGAIGCTADNLKSAIEGENFEVEEMYPAYDAIAHLQCEKGALRSIHYALSAEKIHAAMYCDALASLEKEGDPDIDTVHICPVCGFTHIGEPPEKCPVCGVPSSKFRSFD